MSKLLTADELQHAAGERARLGIVGGCMEALGIPDGGSVLVDLSRQPEREQVCVCVDKNGRLQCKQYVGQTADGEPLVRTRYADMSKSPTGHDYALKAERILGTVIAAFDAEQRELWRLNTSQEQQTTIELCGRTVPVIEYVAVTQGTFAGRALPVVTMKEE